MKIIYQHDARDCGAACLSMIATYYGLRLPISKYRELTKTDKTGANLYGLVECAGKIGLAAEALSGSRDELMEEINSGSISFPFIAHTVNEDGLLHYVVVYGLKHGKFLICDPGKGKLRRCLQDFFTIWTGNIVIFRPTDDFRKGNYVRGSVLKFFGLLRGQYRMLAGILIISLIISGVGIMGAFVFEIVIDNFTVQVSYDETDGQEVDDNNTDENMTEDTSETIMLGGDTISFHIIFIALIVMYLLQSGIQYVRGYLLASMSRKIDVQLSLSYYNHIIDLPVSSVSMYQTGEYMSRFSDASTIRQAISGATITMLLDSVLVIVCGIILFLENSKLFWVSLLMILLDASIILIYRKPVEKNNRKVMEEQARLQSYFKESVDGIETVKAACADQQVKQTTTSKFKKFINAVFKIGLISNSQEAVADMIEMVGIVIILWIGFSMVLSGQITIGSLITFYALLSYFTEPIKNLIELQPTIQTAIVAAERLNDILDLKRENLEESKEGLPIIRTWELKNLDFRYGNRELALEDVSFSVRRGERVAIVGESGSGKTTLAKLLLRFYEAERGEILLNGIDIKNYNLYTLRKEIAYVDQNTFLFSDTIKNNLKLGNEGVTDDEIKKACSISCADEFINKLPLGYDTPLDENAKNLSGGQRQRLVIARALLKNPQLLIFDEATSNLDTITEASIKDTISKLDENITCIIIAHRMTTIKGCDRIYVMEQGKIVESGTHDELMKKGGKYMALWNGQ